MRKLVISSLIAVCAVTASAQEALWSGTNVKSPVVNNDNTVTFNIIAPKAKEVSVSGDFLPPRKVSSPMGEWDAPGVAELTKNDKGVWTYTTEVLADRVEFLDRGDRTEGGSQSYNQGSQSYSQGSAPAPAAEPMPSVPEGFAQMTDDDFPF